MQRALSAAVRVGVSAAALAGLSLALYHITNVIIPGAAGGWLATRVTLEVLMTASGVVAAALALFVIWMAPVSASSAVFALYLAAVAMLAADGSRFGPVRALTHPSDPGADSVVTALLFAAVMTTCLATGVRWTYLFPRALREEDVRRHRQRALLRSIQLAQFRGPGWWIAGIAVLFLLFVTSAVLLDGVPALQLVIVLVLPLLLMVLSIMNLRVNFAAGGPAERERIFWVLQAGITGSILGATAVVVEIAVHLMNATGPVLAWAHAVLLPLALLALVLLMAVAVLYGGAVDPRLVVRTTLQYGMTVLVLTSVFVLIEGITSEFLVSRLRLPARAGGWIAGVIVALLFGPLQAAVARRVEEFLRSRAHHP